MWSEHTIGILKGRFPWLRSIRMKITKKKRSLCRILQLLDATIILHNMLLTFKENMDVTDWIDGWCFGLRCGRKRREEDMSELTKSIPKWIMDAKRCWRSQLLQCFQDFVWHTWIVLNTKDSHRFLFLGLVCFGLSVLANASMICFAWGRTIKMNSSLFLSSFILLCFSCSL